jgi:hypothetical protein
LQNLYVHFGIVSLILFWKVIVETKKTFNCKDNFEKKVQSGFQGFM